MPSDWNPSIRAGTAFDANNFAIALGQIELDDPFSAILTYDGSLDQPWGRIDVQREINSLIAVPKTEEESRASYAAMSNEGDFYFIDENDVATTEKIPGSGIASDDANGRGEMFSLTLTEDGIFATGDGNQVFHRGADAWQNISPTLPEREGYEPTAWTGFARLKDGRVLTVGMARKPLEVPTLVNDASEWDNMSAEDFLKRFNAASEASASTGPESLGVISILDDGIWSEPKLPLVGNLSAVYVDSKGGIWACGDDDTLLFSKNGKKFKNLLKFENELLFNSITEFRGEIILTHDEGISIYRDGALLPLKPRVDPAISGGVPAPLRVEAVDDVLYYFDYSHGVNIWDGGAWSKIEIPAPLLEREFSGPDSLRR